MVIVVRADLGMSPGKMSAQVAHAAVSCAHFAKSKTPKEFGDWYSEGQRKVVLKASGLAELRELERKARSLRLPTALIEDAGMTELPPGTATCLGIGPGPGSLVDKVTGSLPLW
ncbi:MAG: peptidyl-tRNA hydrolase Pth2 [Methanobacteriota archaeon]